jgi:hypothetical protein
MKSFYPILSIETITYPTGFAIKNVYNPYGYLAEVRKAVGNALIWRCDEQNSMGQTTLSTYGNSLTTTKAYNPLGMLTGIYTGSGVQNLSYAWDLPTGNMAGRTDHLHNLTELFTYDNSGRLTGISGPEVMEVEYAPNGNILSKTGVGEYSYGSLPHAVTEVENTGGSISSAEVNLSYSATNRVQSLTKGADSLALWYNDANQRSLSKHYVNGSPPAGASAEEGMPGFMIRCWGGFWDRTIMIRAQFSGFSYF